MVRCYCALGGNLGSVSEVFDSVIAELREHPALRVAVVSRYHRTAAVGAAAEAGGDFLNAVVGIDTDLAPLELLDLLQGLENAHGRVRTVHWGPRTLDLDLLFYGNQILDLPRLVVPHPAAWYRRFVLDPMCDIAPDFVHPVKRLTMHALRERLLARPLTIALAGGMESLRQDLIFQLQPEFPQAALASWLQHSRDDSKQVEPTFVVWLGDCSPMGIAQPFDAMIDAAAMAEFHGSLREAICNALQPAVLEDFVLCPMLRKVIALVSEDQRGLAIRRLKANSDRAFRIVGWRIDIMTQTDLNEQLDTAVAEFSAISDSNEELAENLVAHGYFSFEDLSRIDPEQLAEVANQSVEEVMPIIRAVERKIQKVVPAAFEELPFVPRISATSLPDEFLRNLLRAALG